MGIGVGDAVGTSVGVGRVVETAANDEGAAGVGWMVAAGDGNGVGVAVGGMAMVRARDGAAVAAEV